MKSQLPKVLHSLSGRSLLERVLDCAASVQPDRRLVIVGFGADQVSQSIASRSVETIAHLTDVELVEQREQLGTGHAVQQLMPPLQGYEDDLIVLNGDVPLLRPETLQALLETHKTNGNAATILTAQLDNPKGYGRVFCDSANRVMQMVEDKDCTPEQRQNRRINAGIYCFNWAKLAQVLPTLQNNNNQQEYYLTDAVTALAPVMAVDVEDYQEILGINDRQQLADADRILQTRIKQDWMKAGVTLVDPDSIRIEDGVQLEPDVIIEPQTHLRGRTVIRSGSRIGPGSLIENSEVGEKTIVLFSVISDSVVQANSRIGPYAHLRGHVDVGQGCRIGNFVELKNARLGDRTNVAHLSYIGDATLGNRVNIGAGTITANYDGVHKHRTEIGDRSKTGSNSVLVAPLKLGADVTVAAGSVVTDSVPDDCLVVARARQVVKPGWRLNRSNGVSEPLPQSDLSPKARNSEAST